MCLTDILPEDTKRPKRRISIFSLSCKQRVWENLCVSVCSAELSDMSVQPFCQTRTWVIKIFNLVLLLTMYLNQLWSRSQSDQQYMQCYFISNAGQGGGLQNPAGAWRPTKIKFQHVGGPWYFETECIPIRDKPKATTVLKAPALSHRNVMSVWGSSGSWVFPSDRHDKYLTTVWQLNQESR